MAERLVDLWVPTQHCEAVRKSIRDWDPASYEHAAGDDGTVFRLVVSADKVEPFLDEIEEFTQGEHPVRAIVVAVAAMSPAPNRDNEESEEADDERAKHRVSREELHQSLVDGATVTGPFLTMTALSALVAAIGLSRDNSAVVIGAMVIAPLLGPNMALALATTLADGKLAVRALLANAAGFFLAAAVAAVSGLVWQLDVAADEIAGRTSVTMGEVVLALASGSAGALAATRGAAQSLVGVMVAVSLLPPLVIACMLLVQGFPLAAARAGLLVFANVVCLNFAAVAVFRLRGIRPRTWWDDKRSRKSTAIALAIWLLLLATLVALVLHSGVPVEKPATIPS